MAQWLGQFIGRTHETRVRDAEDALKRAVQAFRDVSAPHEREKKVKNVRHLATRLNFSPSEHRCGKTQRIRSGPVPRVAGAFNAQAFPTILRGCLRLREYISIRLR